MLLIRVKVTMSVTAARKARLASNESEVADANWSARSAGEAEFPAWAKKMVAVVATPRALPTRWEVWSTPPAVPA